MNYSFKNYVRSIKQQKALEAYNEEEERSVAAELGEENMVPHEEVCQKREQACSV